MADSIDPQEDHRQQAGRERAAIIRGYNIEHWKYPETVGNDTYADNVNFNSHDSSEYAIQRLDMTSTMTSEPFVFFEFMKINEEKATAAVKEKSDAIQSSFGKWTGRNFDGDQMNMEDTRQDSINATDKEIEDLTKTNSWVDKTFTNVASWLKELVSTAERDYIGSVALYMPTDIQINDSMMYNEDTRKIGGLLESIKDGGFQKGDVLNATVLTDPTVLAAIVGGATYAAGNLLPGGGSGTVSAISAIASYGVGDIISTELQRSTGKVMNPNELLRYQQTALRSFTFNWTFLPDNEFESNQATGIIKMFRKAAHATRDSSTMITVPDHVVTSFHGARDMVQIPPCYIESVNVTYNPNVSSFFKQNNSPVEIGLSLTLKEIVPIYSGNVEEGF